MFEIALFNIYKTKKRSQKKQNKIHNTIRNIISIRKLQKKHISKILSAGSKIENDNDTCIKILKILYIKPKIFCIILNTIETNEQIDSELIRKLQIKLDHQRKKST